CGIAGVFELFAPLRAVLAACGRKYSTPPTTVANNKVTHAAINIQLLPRGAAACSAPASLLPSSRVPNASTATPWLPLKDAALLKLPNTARELCAGASAASAACCSAPAIAANASADA